jgi:hypothetical protein
VWIRRSVVHPWSPVMMCRRGRGHGHGKPPCYIYM